MLNSTILFVAYLFYAQLCLRVATLFAALHALQDSGKALLIQQATAIAVWHILSRRAASLDKIFDAVRQKCKQFALWQSVLPTRPSLTGCCCCLLNGQQFIYCPFLLLLAINKSLIVFGRRRGQGAGNWESIHLGVDSVQQQKATVYVERLGVAMGVGTGPPILSGQKANKAADSFSMPFYMDTLAQPLPPHPFPSSCK